MACLASWRQKSRGDRRRSQPGAQEGRKRRSRTEGAPGEGDSHKVRASDSELQVINASASGSQLKDAPPEGVCVCVGKRGKYLPWEDLKLCMETQTHLDKAKMDRYLCVRERESAAEGVQYVRVCVCVCLAGGTGADGVPSRGRANMTVQGWIWPKRK